MKLNACTSAKTTLLTRFTGSKLVYSFVALDGGSQRFPFRNTWEKQNPGRVRVDMFLKFWHCKPKFFFYLCDSKWPPYEKSATDKKVRNGLLAD